MPARPWKASVDFCFFFSSVLVPPEDGPPTPK